MALVHSTSLYILLLSTITLLHSTTTLPRLYFTLLDSTAPYPSTSLYIALPWHYLSLLDSLLYFTIALLYSTASTIALLHSTWLYITLPCLYFTLLESTAFYHSSTSLNWLYITLPWPYFTVLDSTSLYIQRLYFTLLTLCYATLHSTWLYCIL